MNATSFHRPASPAPRRLAMAAAGAALALVLSACVAAQITKHGHQFQDTDIAQIQPGMSQEQVRAMLGTPATQSSVAGGNAYYYISSTTSQTAFFKPTEIDRRVLAVYFSQGGSVERVANYGIKDGRVFDFVRRETPSHARDEGILKALFRNLGQKQLFGD